MKKIINFYLLLFIASGMLLTSCKKSNYPGATVSPIIPIYDLRILYKGQDLTLSPDNMFGASKITGVVVSDHTERNLLEGLLVLQDKRRLQQLRGISIPVGNAAANFLPGDSVVIDVVGGILTRENGLLQIQNIGPERIEKISSGNAIPSNRVPSSFILADPDKYESTLVAIVKGGFDPLPSPSDVLSGEKLLNDGFDNIILHTSPNSSFANKNNLPIVGNFFGIVLCSLDENGNRVPKHYLRSGNDVVSLSSVIEITPIIITGYMPDVIGGDGNYEYMQFMATRDIDFSVTPFSVVTTNNAGATNPTGFPTDGWATGAKAVSGNARTYKFNLTSGTVAKGEFFYVGGSSKLINGANSTSIENAKWIRSFNYTTTNGDGFGLKTSGLFANSGNASGFAVFEGTEVTKDTKPIDVVFIRNGGSLYTPGPPAAGYRIANTDFYDEIDPITLQPQPFYNMGTNTMFFNYPASDSGYFMKLGGIYNPRLGKWVKARTQSMIPFTKESTLADLEEPSLMDIMSGGNLLRTDTIPVTTLKD